MSGRLILTIGLPGSGKSWWADQCQRDAPEGEVVVVERDRVREELTGDRRRHTHEVEVTVLCHDRVEAGLRAGKTVIISDTNIRRKYRRPWEMMALSLGATYEERSFLDVPLETCLERNALREDPVPLFVYENMGKYI